MKKLLTLLGTLALVLTLAVSAFAADLPVYSFDKDMTDWGTKDITPFSYKYIVKETGKIGDMVYAGNDNLWNQGMKMYQAGADYAYCFAGNDCLHPANNADPAVCFTAPASGKVKIMYVYYGQTTTKLEVYKNEYKAEAKLKEQTPNMEVTDFEIEIEVKKGDFILFALDCLENNAGDQTPMWIKTAEYLRVDSENNPSTGDAAICAVIVVTAAAAAVAFASKKH